MDSSYANCYSLTCLVRHKITSIHEMNHSQNLYASNGLSWYQLFFFSVNMFCNYNVSLKLHREFPLHKGCCFFLKNYFKYLNVIWVVITRKRLFKYHTRLFVISGIVVRLHFKIKIWKHVFIQFYDAKKKSFDVR